MNTDTRARIRDGDPSAFAELFDAHARGVYNHAFRLTGDWSVAEDVMAATFLEAWRLDDRRRAGGTSDTPLEGCPGPTRRSGRRSSRPVPSAGW
ncbi:RNA polymerase sigma factor [Streptomyces sp. cmx-4-7]|uniref:RNA polymerase sigma factor n=1 Tax=unclassified Streptomyces TaxID=2593676 RepID=UPI003980A7B2